MLARSALQTAHSILSAWGEWVLNEKYLLERAGLSAADAILEHADDVATAARQMRDLLDPPDVDGLIR